MLRALHHCVLGCLLLMATAMPSAVFAEAPVDFNRDIRKILSNNCFQCHGPDAETREAGLRLDNFAGATADGAIVPGDAAASEVMRRIASEDPGDLMPPPDSGKVLTASERAALAAWIDDGAAYAQHWAFVPPSRQPLPPVKAFTWPRNGIDNFILARLEAEGLAPSAEADRNTLIRRVTLDLTGLPPTPEAVAAFVADTAPGAYERLVERLLDSPRYGERWAQLWLDMARYADTKGYEADRDRPMWRYRDWVIDAFNRDLPFDEFTIEQIAGDLLPDARPDQILATAFHRNTMTNDEGGTDDEEFRNAAIVDRVNTTMQVWMGMTMACAQCHTHKYDPITQEEYYRFFAILNQTADSDRNDEAPLMAAPTAAQAQARRVLQARHDDATEQLHAAARSLASERATWEASVLESSAHLLAFGDWQVLGPVPGDNPKELFDTAFAFETAPELGKTWDGGYRYAPREGLEDGKVYSLPGTSVEANLFFREIESPAAREVTLYFGSDDGIKVWLNGDVVLEHYVGRKVEADQERVIVPLRAGTNTLVAKVVNMGAGHGFYFRAGAYLPAELLAILKTAPADRSAADAQALDAYYAGHAPELAPLRERVAAIAAEIEAVDASIPQIPIMRALPAEARRTTHIQLRGSFLDLGEEVEPGVPAVFHALPADAPPDRLALARWLVSRDNPLTARVLANRFWAQFFGVGLVETGEDFGIQGTPPSHPALLDWLAVVFMDQDWSMKALCRTIVTSATYRQSSRVTPALLEQDPYNRLLARGPRFRLEAEMVRDQALAVAGLLSEKMRGPSVMPYQPDGVWQVVYSGDQWKTSRGEDQYRRGLYTYWRRTAPYPSMVAFDAPSREVCEVRRIRTNTPLQALVTLNDPVYVEAAQALARRIVAEGGASVAERVNFAFECVLARRPVAKEAFAVAGLFRSEQANFAADPGAAEQMATNPLGEAAEGADLVELAAWTVVANVLLNLDEAMTKI